MLQNIRQAGRSILDGIARRFRYVSTETLEAMGGEDWLRETDSGEYVGRSTAYSYGPWFRAINLGSSIIAKTSLCLWQIDEKGKWTPARSHYGYKRLCGHGKPNDETLKIHFVQTLTAHAMGHGGGFAYIMRDKFGQATELLQLRPDRTFPVRENGQLLFVTSIGGDYGASGAETRKLLAENTLHIHGLGWDGLTGYSVMDLAARSLGSAIAKERFGARFFRNSATPSVVITTPRKLSDTAMKHLKESWQSLRSGLENAHKPVILEDEATLTPFSHNATDSQLVESVKWDPVIISQFTGVPGYLLGAPGYNSNNTLETERQNLLDYFADPWFVSWEQECNDKLLRESEKEAETHHYEFNRKDLIRVDSAARAAENRAALGGHPWKKVSEVRDEEGLDNEEDTDFIPEPLNMGGANSGNGSSDAGSGDTAGEISNLKSEISNLKSQIESKSLRSSDNRKPKIENPAAAPALRQIWLDTSGRMARRLSTAKTRNAGLDKTAMLKEHGDTLRAAFAPLCSLRGLNENESDQITERLCAAIASGKDADYAAGEITREVFDA